MTGEEELIAEVTGVGVEACNGGEAERVSISSVCRPVPEMDPMHSSCSCLGSDLLLRNCLTQRWCLKSKCLLKANSITTVVNFFKCGDWSFLNV